MAGLLWLLGFCAVLLSLMGHQQSGKLPVLLSASQLQSIRDSEGSSLAQGVQSQRTRLQSHYQEPCHMAMHLLLLCKAARLNKEQSVCVPHCYSYRPYYDDTRVSHCLCCISPEWNSIFGATWPSGPSSGGRLPSDLIRQRKHADACNNLSHRRHDPLCLQTSLLACI